MVEICRCAKASFRVSLTPWMLTPSWPARWRLMSSAGDQVVGPQRNLRGVGAGQRVLILRAAGLGRDLHILHRLKVDRHARDRRRALLQARDDGGHIVAPFAARFQRHHQAADIGGGVDRTRADHGDDAGHIRVSLDRAGGLGLAALHFRKGNVGTRFGHRGDGGRVLQRQEALGSDDIQDQGCGDGREGDHHGRALALQHP